MLEDVDDVLASRFVSRSRRSLGVEATVGEDAVLRTTRGRPEAYARAEAGEERANMLSLIGVRGEVSRREGVEESDVSSALQEFLKNDIMGLRTSSCIYRRSSVHRLSHM